ncbi:MAG: Hsp20/alpha crystallin family protein [Cyanobacteria bacterium P01_A01_bin.123]
MAIVHWRPFHDLKHWEPFGDIDTLRKEMDTLFERFNTGLGRETSGLAFVPSAEINETDTEIYLKLEVPGMSAEDLDIEVTDGAVAITGERQSKTQSEEENTLRSEFYYGKFERFIPLPHRIRQDGVTAEYKDGILNLTLPKSEEEKGKVIKVKVS